MQSVASSSSALASASSVRAYARREPEKTALYLIVREHLETFLQTVRQERGRDLPHYVEEELRRYLRCGILEHGFCRVVCAACRQELVVAYSCNGATHLVLTPVHFLARIASLVPPPRFPLLRLSGVLAPRSSWRAAVVPKRAEPRTCAPTAKPSPKNVKANSEAAASLVSEPDRTERDRTSESAAPEQPRTSLGAGVRRPVGARIDWASLLRRVYLEDVLPCPCGGRRALVADIHERDVVVAILTHLGLPTEAPPIGRARAPSFEAP